MALCDMGDYSPFGREWGGRYPHTKPNYCPECGHEMKYDGREEWCYFCGYDPHDPYGYNDEEDYEYDVV